MRSLRIISDSLYKNILHTKKAQKAPNTGKRLSLRYFYTPKNYKKQTSDFHSDIFIRLKSTKCKQAIFIQIFLYA